MQALYDHLTLAGLAPVALAYPDGTRLLVLPQGGRVLGLYAPGADDNFLWTHPALATAAGTQHWCTQPGWPNPGGDRTWLAPEIALFIRDLAHPMATYAVPAALDPGQWQAASGGGTAACVLTLATTLDLHRTGQRVELRLQKRLAPTPNPLLGTALAQRGLRFAGYAQETTLDLAPTTAQPAAQLGSWNLLQLPSPGHMLIATRAATTPHVVFGTVPASQLTVAPQQVQWHMGTAGVTSKIALAATALSGRAGYLRATADPAVSELVVRQFTVLPQGPYVDALWTPPHATGWAFQACAVRDDTTSFNELEYHAPAATAAPGRGQVRDTSHVWAFRGAPAALHAVATHLLGGTADSQLTHDLPSPLH